jgi:hypothetical protein
LKNPWTSHWLEKNFLAWEPTWLEPEFEREEVIREDELFLILLLCRSIGFCWRRISCSCISFLVEVLLLVEEVKSWIFISRSATWWRRSCSWHFRFVDELTSQGITFYSISSRSVVLE